MSVGIVMNESWIWELLAAERLVPLLQARAKVPLESRLGLGFQDGLERMRASTEASLRAGRIVAESGIHRYPSLWRWIGENPDSPLKGRCDLQVVIYQIPEEQSPLLDRLRDHVAGILTQVG